jgi:hypothetical protein
MMLNNSDGTQEKISERDCLSPIILSVLIPWLVIIPTCQQLTNLLASMSPDGSTPPIAIIGAMARLVLTLLPTVLLGLFWKNLAFRSIFRVWALSGLFSAFTIPIFWLPAIASQAQTIAQIFIMISYSALLVFAIGNRSSWFPKNIKFSFSNHHNPTISRPALALVWPSIFIIAGMYAWPWMVFGALGSLLDTLLQMVLTIAFGFIAAIQLEFILFSAIRNITHHWFYRYILAGLASSIVLLLMVSSLAYPYGGIQLVSMISMLGLGWMLPALSPQFIRNTKDDDEQILTFSRILPATILIAITLFFPTAWLDADELTLVLVMAPGEILGYALLAAGYNAITGIIIATGYSIVNRHTNKNEPSAIHIPPKILAPILLWSFAVAIWSTGVFQYQSLGQTGWHGERMFVIFRDQADLSGAHDIEDINLRRQYVFSSLVGFSEISQSRLRQELDHMKIQYTPYYLVNAIELPANPFLYLWLSAQPEVDRILQSPRLRPLPQRPSIEEVFWLQNIGENLDNDQLPWNLRLIRVDQVWNEFNIRGQGVVIGQADSGAQGNHPEIESTYRGRYSGSDYNWFDPWYGTSAPVDISGHGTHTLGIITGVNLGVAPDATWIACVNLARNLANPALYLDCWQFLFAPYPLTGDPFIDGRPDLGANIFNNSWGCPTVEGCDSETFASAVHALKIAGVYIVVSAGNDGPDCGSLHTPPATYQDVFSVGAINQQGNLANFSSIGRNSASDDLSVKPNLVAPGVDVLSSIPGGGYARYSGTSMAGPHVSGVVALMWSANPNLIGQVDMTTQILQRTAQPYSGFLPACPGVDQFPSTATGYGIIDAYEAVKQAILAQP